MPFLTGECRFSVSSDTCFRKSVRQLLFVGQLVYWNLISYAPVTRNTLHFILGAPDLIVSIGTLPVAANPVMIGVDVRLSKKITLTLDAQGIGSV